MGNIVAGLAKANPEDVKNVQDWISFSMSNHTPDEIRERILTNPDSVCYSYLCRYAIIPEDFMEELMALSTGVLSHENYDETIDLVKKALAFNMKLSKEEPEDDTIVFTTTKDKEDIVMVKDLRDRLDWMYISRFQQFSDDFIRKYADFLDWKELKMRKDISEKLKEEFKSKIAVASKADKKKKVEEEEIEIDLDMLDDTDLD